MNALTRLVAWTLALAMVTLPVVAVLNGWLAPDRWPMRRLHVTGEFQQVGADQIRAAVLPHVAGGFFAVRLADVHQSVSQLPWVREVEVRKRWPDQLEVAIVEHRAFARWGSERLLSDEGELFVVAAGAMPGGLPRLDGADIHVAEVVALYRQASAQFADSGERVLRLGLSARGSWSLELASGTEVELGRGDPAPRLERFARLLPQLRASDPRPLQRADLRYTNGFALRWAAAPEPQPQPAPEAGTPPAASTNRIAGLSRP